MKSGLRKTIRILLFTSALVLTAGAMLGPIYALFVEEIGGSLLDASVAFAVFSITAGIVTLFSGRLSDLIRENELVLVVGYSIIGVGFIAYSFVSSMLSLLIVQVIVGLGEAIYAPAYDSLYSKHQKAESRGSSWGAWEAMAYFTTAFGAILGGFIVQRFGFNAMFYTMGGLSFAAAIYILILPRDVL